MPSMLNLPTDSDARRLELRLRYSQERRALLGDAVRAHRLVVHFRDPDPVFGMLVARIHRVGEEAIAIVDWWLTTGKLRFVDRPGQVTRYVGSVSELLVLLEREYQRSIR